MIGKPTVSRNVADAGPVSAEDAAVRCRQDSMATIERRLGRKIPTNAAAREIWLNALKADIEELVGLIMAMPRRADLIG